MICAATPPPNDNVVMRVEFFCVANGLHFMRSMRVMMILMMDEWSSDLSKVKACDGK
jgi:hypothetical protein